MFPTRNLREPETLSPLQAGPVCTHRCPVPVADQSRFKIACPRVKETLGSSVLRSAAAGGAARTAVKAPSRARALIGRPAAARAGVSGCRAKPRPTARPRIQAPQVSLGAWFTCPRLEPRTCAWELSRRVGPGPAATWGNFSPSTVRSRPGGGREGAGGRRHSLSLPSSLCPPIVPQPLQPARGERVPKVSPGTARARGGPGAGCAELGAWGAPCLAPSGRTRLGSPGAHGPGALGTGWALRGRLGRSAPREAHGLLSSPWVLRFPRVCGRAAGDSFVVSAYASGRKGAEETDRRAGSGVEHRARDKQVGDGKVGGVAQPLALKYRCRASLQPGDAKGSFGWPG